MKLTNFARFDTFVCNNICFLAVDPAPFFSEGIDWSGPYCGRVEMIQIGAFQGDCVNSGF